MSEAIALARVAQRNGEVPVGAVVVFGGVIVGRGHNAREHLADVTAHAELLAVRAACVSLGRWRLYGCSVYVTLEPCSMCGGCLVQARVDRLVYGADDFRAGAAGSVANLVAGVSGRPIPVTAGVLGDECRALLREFFSGRRK